MSGGPGKPSKPDDQLKLGKPEKRSHQVSRAKAAKSKSQASREARSPQWARGHAGSSWGRTEVHAAAAKHTCNPRGESHNLSRLWKDFFFFNWETAGELRQLARARTSSGLAIR